MGKQRTSSGSSPRLPLFSIRLSAATKSRWQQAAEREGRTLAGYIKHAVESYPHTAEGQETAQQVFGSGRRELWFLDSRGAEHHITSLSWEVRETPTSPWQARKLDACLLGLIEKIFVEKGIA